MGIIHKGRFYKNTYNLNRKELVPCIYDDITYRKYKNYIPFTTIYRYIHKEITDEKFEKIYYKTIKQNYGNLFKYIGLKYFYFAPIIDEYSEQVYLIDDNNSVYLPIDKIKPGDIKKEKYEINKIEFIRKNFSWKDKLEIAPDFLKIYVIENWFEDLKDKKEKELDKIDSFMDGISWYLYHINQLQYPLHTLIDKREILNDIFYFLRKNIIPANNIDIEHIIKKIGTVRNNYVYIFSVVYFDTSEEYEEFSDKRLIEKSCNRYLWYLKEADLLLDSFGKHAVKKYIKAKVEINDIVWMDIKDGIPYILTSKAEYIGVVI